MKRAIKKDANNGANIGFEAELWKAADALRNNIQMGDKAGRSKDVLGRVYEYFRTMISNHSPLAC